jgi:precorrin-2 dehydrogenase/sirohydrochlorin ferrochelatase
MLYPVFMKLDHAACLVVGGGSVGARKAKGLLAALAEVTVVSPELHRDLRGLADSGRISWISREFEEGDLKGCRLVVAATGSLRVNRMVHDEAMARGILVNSVDDPAHSSFFVPAVARRGHLAIAVSTSGHAPYLSRRLREHLEAKLYPGLEEDLEELRRVREGIKGAVLSYEENRKMVERELEPLVRKILARLEAT